MMFTEFAPDRQMTFTEALIFLLHIARVGDQHPADVIEFLSGYDIRAKFNEETGLIDVETDGEPVEIEHSTGMDACPLCNDDEDYGVIKQTFSQNATYYYMHCGACDKYTKETYARIHTAEIKENEIPCA
jgi:hypothetical protein